MVTVEPATPSDADALADLWVDLARDQRRHGSHLLPEQNRTPVRESLARHAAEGCVAVAREGSDPVGFVRFGVENGPLTQAVTRGVVRDLYVVPAHRRSGVGSALLDAAEDGLRARGVDAIGLEAMATNADAVRFYERRGYRPRRIGYEREVETDKHSREEE